MLLGSPPIQRWWTVDDIHRLSIVSSWPDLVHGGLVVGVIFWDDGWMAEKRGRRPPPPPSQPRQTKDMANQIISILGFEMAYTDSNLSWFKSFLGFEMDCTDSIVSDSNFLSRIWNGVVLIPTCLDSNLLSRIWNGLYRFQRMTIQIPFLEFEMRCRHRSWKFVYLLT